MMLPFFYLLLYVILSKISLHLHRNMFKILFVTGVISSDQMTFTDDMAFSVLELERWTQ